jgi:hypothetical protein
VKQRHTGDTLPLPRVQLELPDPSATGRAVFVDATGRRAHRLLRWGLVVGASAAAYLVAVASSLLGGPSLPSALLLVERPGQASTSPDTAPGREGDLASAPAVTPEVTRREDTTDATPVRMSSRRSDGNESRSQAGQPGQKTRGKSGDTPAADRRTEKGQPTQPGQSNAGQKNTSQGNAGQRKKGDPPGHVRNGRGERAAAAPQSRSADQG